MFQINVILKISLVQIYKCFKLNSPLVILSSNKHSENYAFLLAMNTGVVQRKLMMGNVPSIGEGTD